MIATKDLLNMSINKNQNNIYKQDDNVQRFQEFSSINNSNNNSLSPIRKIDLTDTQFMLNI